MYQTKSTGVILAAIGCVPGRQGITDKISQNLKPATSWAMVDGACAQRRLYQAHGVNLKETAERLIQAYS